MDLYNMTNRVQIHEFYKKVNRENVYLSSQDFQNWWFIKTMEFGNKCKILTQYPLNYT